MLSVNQGAGFNVAPLGDNGNGASITGRKHHRTDRRLVRQRVGSGNGGKIAISSLQTNVNLAITGSLTANAGAIGTGGSITVSANSSSAFVITVNSSVTNGVQGVITADGGTSRGNGGSISITNLGTGGITIASDADVSASAGSFGNGGSISLTASGALITVSGTLSAGAAGSGAFNGGQITLASSLLSVSGTPA